MPRSATLSATAPLSPPRSLAHELVARLTADITSGKIPPGSQLPTEQELIAAAGVSRTVVREAVAALRAEGLVVTRQGVGAFVPANARRPFRVELDQLSSLRDVLDDTPLRRKQLEAFARIDSIMSTGNQPPSVRAAEIVLATMRKARG